MSPVTTAFGSRTAQQPARSLWLGSSSQRFKSYDVAIIGGGPGGYVAAIKAAQLGMNVACVEKRNTLGGTCLNVGCIPSKAMLNLSHMYEESKSLKKHGLDSDVQKIGDLTKLQSSKNQIVSGLTKGIEGLFKKNKIDHINGTASFETPNKINVSGKECVEAKNIIIATGSESSPMPGGILTVDEDMVLTSTGALNMKSPPKKMIIIGAGIIGLELGSVYRRFGTEIEVVEFLDRIAPAFDQDVSIAFKTFMEKSGFKFHLSTKAVAAKVDKANRRVTIECVPASGDGPKKIIEGDCVMISVGRRPFTSGLELQKVGIETDKLGRIPVADHREFKTQKHSNIYAIGDVIDGPMLAHKAEEEGVAAALSIAKQPLKHEINYNAIPGVVYTSPEVATVGQSECSLKSDKKAFKSVKFPMAANSRSRATGVTEGLVKLLYCPDSKKVLGASIINAAAGEMIHEIVLAIQLGATVDHLADMSHAHPTLSEAVKEAAMMAAYGKPIHM